jgi:hypothetical protein
MGKGRKCARGYTLQSGPEGPSWCRSRSRPGRSKTTMHQVSGWTLPQMLAEIDAQATNPLPVPERAYEMGNSHPWCAPSEAARGHIRAQIPNQQRASAPPPVPPRESPTTRQPWLPGPRKRVRRVSRSAETERSMAASHTTRDMHGNTAGHTLFPDAKGEIPKVSTSIYTEPRPPSGGLAPTVAGAPTLIAGKLRSLQTVN